MRAAGIASSSNRAPRACTRCRRLKLKCDAEDPCRPCLKRGQDCARPGIDPWKAHHLSFVAQKQDSSASPSHHATTLPKQRNSVPETNCIDDSDYSNPINSKAVDVSLAHDPDVIPSAQPLKSLPELQRSSYSVLDMVNETRNLYKPQPVVAGSQGENTLQQDSSRAKGPAAQIDDDFTFPRNDVFNNVDASQNAHTFQAFSRLPVSSLWAALPSLEVTRLLVDTYFDRVHWFMLVFHQDNFRKTFERLQDAAQHGTLEDSDDNFAFTCVLLAVAIIGLQHLCPYRRQLLNSLNDDGYKRQANLIVTLRVVIFDVVALSRLESVQVCLLFGSFHLYHANPRPAWPLLGCALRVAQALGLHRNKVSHSAIGGPKQTNIALTSWTEEEKRCWWAFYEIDRFCSTIYGYPLNISNQDCDLDLLDPVTETRSPYSNMGSTAPSLRAYKYHVAKLSIILTDVLSDLYGPRFSDQGSSSSFQTQSIKQLIEKVARLDQKLREWWHNIPTELRLDSDGRAVQHYLPPEVMHAEIGASGPQFDAHIFRMQALALKLAYENARIMAHRPLLTYRMSNSTGTVPPSRERQDPFRISFETCRDAALQTASIGALPEFREALDTYAVAFVGMQCFTAGVVLCLIASHEPLTINSHEAKIAIRQLLTMQMALKSQSPIAAQSLKVLQKLARLVFSKEIDGLVCETDSQDTQMAIEAPQSSSAPLQYHAEYGDRDVREQAAQATAYANSEPLTALGSAGPAEPNSDPMQNFECADAMETDFNFIQNKTFAQTMQEIDQLISDSQVRPDGLLEPSSNVSFGFSGQEQGWIWRSDFAHF